MFELLVSILLMMGIQFERTESGQLNVNGDAEKAFTEVRVNENFEALGGEPALNAVVIHDGQDGRE